MKLALGADHGGYSLKETLKQHLLEQGYQIEDCGTFDTASCHYPVYAEKVARMVAEGKADLGILVCGTGIGMSIAANKIPGIRAAAVSTALRRRPPGNTTIPTSSAWASAPLARALPCASQTPGSPPPSWADGTRPGWI